MTGSDGDQRLFDRKFAEITAPLEDELAVPRAIVRSLIAAAAIWIGVGLIVWALP